MSKKYYHGRKVKRHTEEIKQSRIVNGREYNPREYNPLAYGDQLADGFAALNGCDGEG